MFIININTLSLNLVLPGKYVLDLGCADGRLGAEIRKMQCKVVGVEIDSELAKIARKKLNKTIHGNIDNPKVFSRITKLGLYDIIFASAILEHLINPENIVLKLSKLLKKDGYMIIILPNIAHWTARLSVMLGKFDYQDSGIFDRTHLHFYTIKTAVEFLKKSNLTIEVYDYELTEFPIVHRIFKLFPNGKKFQYKFYRLFPSFFAYQMVFKVRPSR